MTLVNSFDRTKLLNLIVPAGRKLDGEWGCGNYGNWYDLTIQFKTGGAYRRRLAGRIETGKHGISDPAMATEI